MEAKESFFSEYGFEIIKIGLSAILILLSLILPVSDLVKIIICVTAAFVSGYNVLTELPEVIKEKRFFDENTLMIIACVVAFILGERTEGALIMVLFSFGELLEDVATDNSRKKIAGLAEIKSEVARLVVGRAVVEVSPEEVPVGSIIEVRRGDRVPIDGELVDDEGELDLKAITGESKLYSVIKGGKVYGGAINEGHPIRIKTTAKYSDSTAERIISLVENSGERKAKSQKFITEFAKIYTPCVIALAVIISVVPPLFDAYDFTKWILKALNFMVISCPCALVISVPLGYFVGIGSLARRGILVKGGNYVEALSKIKTFAFDKTGTLTEGKFKVCGLRIESGEKEKEITDVAYALEKSSSHPIAKAVVSYCEDIADKNVIVSGVKEHAGKGISGTIYGNVYSVGNGKMINGAIGKTEEDGSTVLYVSKNGKVIGRFIIEDAVKENAAETINKLRKIGADKFYVISGDEKTEVEKIAKKTGIDNYGYSLLPEEKLEKVEEIIKSSGSVAYAGDGINDAPVIRRADVGIAMGGLGSEAAIKSADVVIMDDDVGKIATLYSHSKKIKRVVLQNIICSIAVKIAIMSLSVIFAVPVYIAMLGDVGVMLLAVLNSLRNYRVKE